MRNSLRARVALIVILIGYGYFGSIGVGTASAEPPGQTTAARIRISSFQPDKPLGRARRPMTLTAVVENTGKTDAVVQAALSLPDGVTAAGPKPETRLRINAGEEKTLAWKIEANRVTQGDLRLTVHAGGAVVAETSLAMQFLPAMEKRKLPYLPEPVPAKTSILIGAHNCPLWDSDRPEMWNQILKHPERTPALGFYAEENPEVADWETKWAVEHGISFFVYCWYRTSQGEPVKTQFSAALHDALFKSRYGDKMKFTIMWENQVRGKAGVSDEKDLLNNLLPFWIENYFKRANYLKVDNKPVLFIYRPEFLVDDLGSEEKVAQAFVKMREACKKAGFDGLTILGEYRGTDPGPLRLMKRLGLDYSFAYCWYVANSPTPEQAASTQMQYIRKTQELNIIPQVVTVSQAWSGWNDEGSIWKIPPTEFEMLLRQAKDFVGTLPPDQLGSKMLLLDNWNEWGEGHYIAPYREYGFGYLDAVRKVFASNQIEHTDLLPEDIGLGPYDSVYIAGAKQEAALLKQASRHVVKGKATEPGLVAWWTFDEENGSPVALDYSGNRLGGRIVKATRAPGISGKALVCDGGCVVVANRDALSFDSAMTVECWVKTDTGGQDNRWLVNRVYGGGSAAGFRLGVMAGKPCFEVPMTDWSHHLIADTPLPTGRWVHLAGTFDGKTMRLYVDGEERGTMERAGPIHPSAFPLSLGSYEAGHPAFFTGLLDEVKLYNRALSHDEVRAQYGSSAH